MYDVRRSPPAEDRGWDEFVAGHPHGHLLQSSAWGHFRSDWGWQVERVVVGDERGRIVAGAQALIRRTRGGTIAYVPRGPVAAPDDPAWPALHAALQTLARRGRGVALRIEPHWPDVVATRDWLTRQGFAAVDPVQPPSTLRLDLSQPEAALLGAMKQKCRYNIRLASRRGVEVVEGDREDLPTFGRLMMATAARDGFNARPAAYFADAWRAFGRAAHLYLARRAGEVLAAVLVFHGGDSATYLYGASSDRGRQDMPNHLVQWEAIRRARSDGRRWYDLWGIPDAIGRAVVAGGRPEDVPAGAGGLWGVWGFKRGFGGEVFRAVGAWDEVYSPGRYWLGRRLARLRGALVERL